MHASMAELSAGIFRPIDRIIIEYLNDREANNETTALTNQTIGKFLGGHR